MPFKQITLGLTLTIPTNGTRNWGNIVEKSAWEIISGHRHTAAGDGLQMITDSYANLSVTSAKLATNINSNKQAATLTPAGTTQTIDWNLGNKQILDLSSATGDVTLTLNNPQTAGQYRIKVIQGGTKRGLIWPAVVKFPGAFNPTDAHVINTDNIINLDFDGTNYYVIWDVDFS